MRLQVFFGKHIGDLPRLNITEGLLIRAANDNWNDFGYSSLFDLFVIRNGVYSTPWRFRVGFIGTDESPFELINNQLEQRGPKILPASEFPEFFSMLPSEDDYARFFNEYGRDVASNYLLAIGDVIALKGSNRNSDFLKRALNSDIFGMSLIRSDDAFEAFQSATRIFNSNFRVRVDSAPRILNIPAFHVSGYSDELNFEFRFSQSGILPKRITAIIGSNGVGKSYTLRKILEHCVAFSESRTGPLFSRVVAVATSRETEATFPRAEGSPIDYVHITSSGAETARDGFRTLAEDIHALARNSFANNQDSSRRWYSFQRAVSELLPFSSVVLIPHSSIPENLAREEIIGFDELASRESVVMRLINRLSGEMELRLVRDGKFYRLSSGQSAFVRLAAHLSRHVEQGSIVLIDEPESHLHPRYISQFMSMLDSILGASSSVAVIATHSPYIIRELPNEQVRMIHVNSARRIFIARPRLKTLGADVGAISASVFGNEMASDAVRRLADKIFENPNIYDKWEDNLDLELSVEAVLMIRRLLRERGESEHDAY